MLNGFGLKELVGWQNAYVSFEAAIRQYDTKEAQFFLENCLDRVVGIMLDQQ